MFSESLSVVIEPQNLRFCPQLFRLFEHVLLHYYAIQNKTKNIARKFLKQFWNMHLLMAPELVSSLVSELVGWLVSESVS